MTCRVTYFGTATMLLEIGSVRLLTDPVFDPPGKRYHVLGIAGYRRASPAPPLPDLGPIDAVLLSHDQHGDNLDRSGLEVARRAARIVTTGAGARRLGGLATGLEPWESRDVTGPEGDVVRVTATPARHGPAWLVPLAGPVIGFALEAASFSGVVWISGDTVLFDGIRQIADRFRIRSAFLHVGRATLTPTWPLHYTLTADEAAEVAGIAGGPPCYPVHYDGWSHFREGRSDVERAFEKRGTGALLRWLPRAEAVQIPV